MKKVAIVLVLFLGFTSTSWDFYGDVDKDSESFSVGIAGQNQSQVTSLTAIFPLSDDGEWAGFYISRQLADGMVVSEVLNAHIQGGFKLKRIDVEGYVEAERDKWRMIDLSLESGYFLRPGTHTTRRGIELSGGAGNFTERRDDDEEIGRPPGDVNITFGWLAFVSADWKDVSGVFRFKPSLDFSETQIEASMSFQHELNDNLSFGLTTLSVFDSTSIAETDLHSSYMLQLTYKPD